MCRDLDVRVGIRSSGLSAPLAAVRGAPLLSLRRY